MPTLSELSVPLFKQAEGKATEDATIFYGTALQNSADGEVLVRLDQAIYPLGNDDDALNINLKIDNDVASLEDDSDASTDLVYYEEV